MKRILLILSVFLFANIALADSWQYKKELKKDELKFENITIVRERDTRHNDKYPKWALKIYKDKELMALYRGIWFEDIVYAKEIDLFVGISNRGMPGTAIVVFDSDGNLRLMRKHQQGLFEYCMWSITRVREWYNQENPNLKIKYNKETHEPSITVNGCNGKVIDIIKKLDNV